MNKIISMSVWGDSPRYIVGAKRQVELAKKYFPDWKTIIYTDNAKNFLDIEDQVEIIEVKESTSGYFWRFRPMFENEDNIVLIRDSDGRITIREAMAVEEWLNSSKSFHTFRDHEAHYEFPIIACAFGYKGKLPNHLLSMMEYFEENYFYYTNDQVYLRDYVWDYVKDNSLVHSMMDEGWFKDTRKNLINKFSFCGNGWDENDMPLYPEKIGGSLDNASPFDEGVIYEVHDISN
jgi:hypothetical protein